MTSSPFVMPEHAPTRHLRRHPGDRNFTRKGFDFHPEVFLVSGGLVLLFGPVYGCFSRTLLNQPLGRSSPSFRAPWAGL